MNLKSKILYAALAISLASCHNPVFEDEGDCEVNYYLRFVYDMNLKWADAFPSEVDSYNLYVFDSGGMFVKEYTAFGEEISKEGYLLKLDLEPGDYQLLAWCGLYNGENVAESFRVPTPRVGVTTIEEMTCRLNTKSDATYPVYSDERIYFMYHGLIDVSLPDSQDGSDYYYTMPLIKDTNHIRIILQELDGDGLNSEDYNLRLEAANGMTAWNNELSGDQTVVYLPWNQESDEVGVGRIDVSEGGLMYVKGLVADLSTCRMMASHQDDMLLTITRKDSGEEIIARVPVIQYALLSRKYYEMAYNHTMTDQEFLDREDEYIMTFFIYNNKWMDAYIDILSWRIVLHDYSVGNQF